MSERDNDARRALTEGITLARTRVRSLLAGEHGALSSHVERELGAIERHLERALIAHVAREVEVKR